MPIYDYECPECGTHFENMCKVSEREMASCPECTVMAPLRIKSAPRLSSKMGLDPDFPTAYAQWGKRRSKLGSGRMKDSNNQQLTGSVDHEKEAWKMRKREES